MDTPGMTKATAPYGGWWPLITRNAHAQRS